MTYQPSIELRDGFRKAVEADKQGAETAPDKQKAPAFVGYGSDKQKRWIYNLLFERFAEAEAQDRWDRIDWANMTRPVFNKMRDFLLGVPTLEEQGMGEMARKPEVLRLPEGFCHGTYTVTYADGTYTVIRVRRQNEDDSFKPGETLLSYQSGADNEHDYKGFAHLTADRTVKIWQRHRNNPRWTRALHVMLGSPEQGDEAATVDVDVRCMKCFRPLTVPTSINHPNGPLGPDCAKKMGLG